jgi:DNA primase
MNPDHQQRLERDIDRVLKSLPEISAPEHLLGRVLARIQVAAAKPWYQQAWSEWPVAARFVSAVLLSAAFGGLCYFFWKAPEIEILQPLLAKARSAAGIADALWRVTEALLGACAIAFRQLSTGALISLAGLALVGYALFVGLGTVYFRVALARR